MRALAKCLSLARVYKSRSLLYTAHKSALVYTFLRCIWRECIPKSHSTFPFSFPKATLWIECACFFLLFSFLLCNFNKHAREDLCALPLKYIYTYIIQKVKNKKFFLKFYCTQATALIREFARNFCPPLCRKPTLIRKYNIYKWRMRLSRQSGQI